jgi:hypothetical protein
MEEDALEVMLREGERRLEPNQFFAWLYTQVGVVPAELADLEHAMRSVANRIGGAVIVASLLIASALLARVHDLRWYAFAGFCVRRSPAGARSRRRAQNVWVAEQVSLLHGRRRLRRLRPRQSAAR